MKKTAYFFLLLLIPFFTYSQEDMSIYELYEHSKLTHRMTPEEALRKDEIGRGFTATDPPRGSIINISEFHPIRGVMIRYPLGIPVSLVKTFSELAQVTVIVSSSQQNAAANAFNNAGVNMDNVEFLIAPSDSYWTRDYGPWFIIDGNDEFGIVDFPYNRPRPNDDNIASKAAEFYDVNLFNMNVVHTGGNYMTDGYHVSSSTTLVQSENSSLTLEQINQRMKDYLGIENYHLFEDPQGEYIEHIDCWAKFLAVDKILVVRVATSDPRYQVYENIAEWFENADTPWGNKYRVYRVYAPGGSRATPYTNSFIMNHHVFVPQTGSPHDAAAIEVYQEAMPGYTVVPVMQAGSTPWLDTDALHCRTHEIADTEMLLIKHYPLLGEQNFDEGYTIHADITAYSGESFVTDSMLIYYKINNDEWKTTLLEPQSGKQWEGTISGCGVGDEIAYYLFAKDNSGRRECHPYIGKYDPHIFTISGEGAPKVSVDVDAFDEISFSTDDSEYYLHIANNGSSSLTFELNTLTFAKGKIQEDILSYDPRQGLITPGDSQKITIVAHTTHLSTGVYNEVIQLLTNDPDRPEIQIPIMIKVYDGIIVPDTIWVDANTSLETSFTLTSDFDPELILTAVNTNFNGRIFPEEGDELPLTILQNQEIVFKAEYEGIEIETDTLYFDCAFVTDKMSRKMIVAFIPKNESGITEEQLFKTNVYPNPAANSVTFTFDLEKPRQTEIIIYDPMGKIVARISQKNNVAGKQAIVWNIGSNVASGVYFYNVITDEKRSFGKLIILK
ncbi:MAG: agmatine deiminase family protein [Bacteroidales bacterium]|jgi:agmatine/peptidylarginine deiminase|nr:agmatine deiminase family protein [Bacteroidales bacterium]